MGILKRLLKIVVFSLTLPLLFICAWISVTVMALIALVIYILKGDKKDTLIDFIFLPLMWAVNLPYKILGE